MAKKEINPKDLFDYTSTDKKSYTKILNSTVSSKKVTKGTKNRITSRRPVGKIVMMNPKDFLKKSFAKKDVTKEKIRNPHFKSDSYRTLWPLPYIDTLAKKGFGRGRALMCIHWKIPKIPVFVVARTEADIDKFIKGGNRGKINQKKNSGKTSKSRR